jgi:hypothetical protein
MMRASAALLGALLLGPGIASAQLELPQASPLARVMQTVGLTEIEVEYSSPAVRGRKVFGDLVPFGTHWRTGANRNTLLRVSGPVSIGGQEVSAGTYSLHTIPGPSAWTVIVNRKTDGGGSSSYDSELDVLRAQVTPTQAPFRERMTFVFSNSTDDGTRLDLEWATLRVSLAIEVPTAKQVDAAIDRSVGNLWRPPAQAARYLVDQGRDLERALQLVDRSLAIEENWYNLWVKARIRDQSGDRRAAIRLTRRALDRGDDSGAFRFYSGQMKAALETWSKR